MYDLVTENKARYIKYAVEFRKVFGTPLHLFWDIVTGFDIIKFDEEYIKPADDMSTKEAIRAKYGEAGVKLIENLIASIDRS